MKYNFTKMHGIGNDYIYFNCMEKELDNPSELALNLSRRHFSVGADGIVMICHSDVADAKMRMFNADGSEGKMCGNAIRCVGKYLFDNHITDKCNLDIETLSGIKHLELNIQKNHVQSVKVDMGTAVFDTKLIPVVSKNNIFKDEPVQIDNKLWNITCVSMGNPHAIVYVNDVNNINIEKTGPLFENNQLFPDRINTEFIQIISNNVLKMRVWERGSGETYACGTGSCAAVAASVLNNICPKNTPITVQLIGGNLEIVCTDEYKIYMTGTATKVYEGVFDDEDQN